MNDQTKGRIAEGTSPKSPGGNFRKVSPNPINRAVGVLLLVIVFGIYWIYGWAGEIRNAATSKSPANGLNYTPPTPSTQTLLGNLYLLSSIFVVIGFGLLLAYFKKATTSALLTVLFTVSFTILISPICEKFWFNIFITDFHGAQPTATDPARFLEYSLGGINIYLDFYNLRIALANSIAQMVVLLAIFGRLNPAQLIVNSLIYNLLWNLNYFLCAFLVMDSPDSRIADDYQITTVYLFAATYGLIVSFLLPAPQTKQAQDFSASANSKILSHLGTFFLFLSFSTTTPMYTVKYSLTSSSSIETQRGYIWQEGFISIFITMSASIIAHYSLTILLKPSSKIGIRGSLIGTITGAIMYGSVAGTSINIGAAIAVGLAAGALSAVYFEKVYPNINGEKIRDTFGLGSIWIVAFLGTFLIAPTVLKTYYNYSVDLPTLYPQNTPPATYIISNLDVAGWALVYVGVSIAIALLGGLVMGIVLKLFARDNSRNFDDGEYFMLSAYGLRNLTGNAQDSNRENAYQDNTAPQSAQNLTG